MLKGLQDIEGKKDEATQEQNPVEESSQDTKEKEGEATQKQDPVVKCLQDIREKVDDAIEYLFAYNTLKTSEDRMAYEDKGKLDISKYSEELKRVLNRAVFRVRGGNTSNAYQILGVANSEKDAEDAKDEKDMTPEEIEKKIKNKDEMIKNRDENIRRKTFEMIKATVEQSELTDIESIDEMLDNITRYFWAYSKINTQEKRKDYDFQILSRKGEETLKGLGKIAINKLKREEPYSFKPSYEISYNKIDVIRVGELESCAFPALKAYDKSHAFYPPEKHASIYRVEKHRDDGRGIRYLIASNIDMELMKDEEYSAKVQELLLSDEAIKVGQKHFAGYVGELDNDRNIKYDLECIGAMKNWVYSRIKAGKKKDIGEKTGDESPDKPTNPDAQVTPNAPDALATPNTPDVSGASENPDVGDGDR